jgi:hypothetical protein
MTRYILVPGACHGGWWYQPVVDALREAGHEADAITLSGLDPDGPPAAAPTSTGTGTAGVPVPPGSRSSRSRSSTRTPTGR